MKSLHLSGLLTKARNKPWQTFMKTLESNGGSGFIHVSLHTMILNGKNEKANRYLREAAIEIRHALSDALFEITTSPEDIEDDDDVE